MAIKLLIGGSPCTHWSIAKKSNRETEAAGLGWELFKNYLIAKEKFKPDFFLYENNKSASQAIKDQIAYELGVGNDPDVRFTYINSALVSAQFRERFYVTNFGDIIQPIDRHIYLRDILEPIREDWRKVGKWTELPFFGKNNTSRKRKIDILKDIDADKSYTITTKKGHPQNYILNRERTMYSNLTIGEYELLQTLPIGYTKAASEAERYKAIGNGWTAEVIIHILEHALSDVSKDEEIIVLSLYDGIATGRYCLEKMGFRNITYHAFEIEEAPIKIAMSNYPDIIQHGNAFAVREHDWKIGLPTSENKEVS